MSEQRDVLLAVKALVASAAPAAEVVGFDGDTSIPRVIAAGGMVLGYPGEPGEAEVDLSPVTYNYAHRIPIDVAVPRASATDPDSDALDQILAAIGAAVAADRTLGGRCCWLEVTAGTIEDRNSDGVTLTWAELAVIAHYSTEHPLG